MAAITPPLTSVQSHYPSTSTDTVNMSIIKYGPSGSEGNSCTGIAALIRELSVVSSDKMDIADKHLTNMNTANTFSEIMMHMMLLKSTFNQTTQESGNPFSIQAEAFNDVSATAGSSTVMITGHVIRDGQTQPKVIDLRKVSTSKSEVDTALQDARIDHLSTYDTSLETEEGYASLREEDAEVLDMTHSKIEAGKDDKTNAKTEDDSEALFDPNSKLIDDGSATVNARNAVEDQTEKSKVDARVEKSKVDEREAVEDQTEKSKVDASENQNETERKMKEIKIENKNQ